MRSIQTNKLINYSNSSTRKRCRGSRRRQSWVSNLIYIPYWDDRQVRQPIREGEGGLRTNQITPGAGLTQLSGREKVTIVEEDCQMGDRHQPFCTKTSSNACEGLQEDRVCKVLLQGCLLKTRARTFIGLKAPFFMVSVTTQLCAEWRTKPCFCASVR